MQHLNHAITVKLKRVVHTAGVCIETKLSLYMHTLTVYTTRFSFNISACICNVVNHAVLFLRALSAPPLYLYIATGVIHIAGKMVGMP